jgi:serine/threonine protein kinase/tetratricopeptide (TPR) repeat protein
MNEKPLSGVVAFDLLADSFLARLRRGERPGVSEYVERHPELAREILDFFPALVEMEGLKADAVNATGSFIAPPAGSDGPAIPQQLGDYRILRLIGQGGMGVVYEARRESLSAHVALKVLRHRFRDQETLLRRFRNEARSAARLHHTNIVPVFDFGDHDGILYYVMQYIPGQGLDRVLADVRRLRAAGPSGLAAPAGGSHRLARSVAEGLLTGRFRRQSDPAAGLSEPGSTEAPSSTGPSGSAMAVNVPTVDSGSAVSALGAADSTGQWRYHREVARIGTQVADALGHAHSLGVLHRDVKPSNLLLDARGDVWVADFGLAKLEEGEDLTETGDVLGTLRYMAPERFDGRSDRRSDIFALGATLYEMIALRPAFNAPDRAGLVRQILEDEPPALRTLDRRVPRDLETIVHKAMARDPAARYQTAGAMAADLRLFLQDRPIEARRSTPIERAWRWCRRNPVLAGMSTSLLLVFLGAFIAVTAALVQARADRRLADGRLVAARASEAMARTEKARADVGFAQARSAVDDYLNNVTEDDILKETPKLKPLRRKLLESAATFYRGFLRDRREDPSLRAEIAAVTLRMAKVGQLLSDPTAAENARQALSLYESLAKESPPDPAILAGWIETLDLNGRHERAIEVGESALASQPDDSRITIALARAYRSVFNVRNREGDLRGAVEMARRSSTLNQRILNQTPDQAEAERELGANFSDLGVLLSVVGRPIDSMWLWRKTLDRARGLVARHPERLLYMHDVLISLFNLAHRQWDCGFNAQAIALAGEGLALSRDESVANPDITYAALLRFRFARSIGEWRAVLGQPHDDADDEALAAFPGSRVREPAMARFDAWGFVNLADRRIGSLTKARSPLTPIEQSRIDELGSRAISILATAADAGDFGLLEMRNPSLWPNLRKRDDFRALVTRLEAGRRGVVSEATQTAPAKAAPTVPTPGELDTRARSERANTQFAAAVVLRDLGRTGEARRLLVQSRAEFESLVREDPRSPEHRFDLSRALRVEADLANDRGRLSAALAGWVAARDLQVGVAVDPACDPISAATCRFALGDLGETFCSRGLYAEAAAALEPGLAAGKPNEAAVDLMAGLNALLLGDVAGYRRIRDRALSRYAASDHPWQAADLAMLAAIWPDADGDRAAMIPLAARGLELPGQNWPKVYLALSNLRAGRLVEAKEQLDRYDRDRPPGVEPPDEFAALAHSVRALVVHRMGRVEEARRDLSTSRRILDVLGIQFLEGPLSAPRRNFWCWAESRILIAEAAAGIEGRLRRPDPWSELMNAWGESQCGRPDRARAALSRIAPEDAKTADVIAARAHILLSLGDRDRAREDLESAIRLEPENVLARMTRGRLALADRRPEEAAEELVRALAGRQDHPDASGLRSILERLFAADDAVFARAVALRPSDRQLWVAKGRHLAWLGHWNDAADAFGRGIGPRPQDEDWFEYGALLLLAGDDAGYRRLCDRVVDQAKQPGWGREWEHFYVAARLARGSAASGVAPEAVIGWADAARQLMPNRSWGDYLAGAARLRGRDQDEAALKLLNAANQRMREPGAGLTCYALAIAHRRLGHESDAARWLERADNWMVDRDREAASASVIEPRCALHDYLDAKLLQREARPR